MSDRDGSSFATAPVAPGGGRRPLVVGIVVVGLIVGSFSIARLTPATGRPAPTAGASERAAQVVADSPSAPPATIVPPATPLPRLEWFSAPWTPARDLIVDIGSHLHRLAGDQVSPDELAQTGQDLLMLDARGDTICLCWRSAGPETGGARELDLVRRRSDGSREARRTVTVLPVTDPSESVTARIAVALEPSPDGRLVYLTRATRTATAWQVGLDVIDVATAAIADSKELVSLPQLDRSVILAEEPPVLRVAPDGAHLLVVAGTQRLTSFGTVTSTRRAWIVALGGPRLGPVDRVDVIADAGSDVSVGPCAWIAFAAPAIIAKGCDYRTADGGAAFEIRRYDLTGEAIDLAPIHSGSTGPGPDQILIDTGVGIAYTWDPVGHSLLATDLVGGGWRSAHEAPQDRMDPTTVTVVGARPADGSPTTWSNGRSATAPAVARTLVGSPDGRLLFAVGSDEVSGGTSGIWVFDAATLRLVERWPALAVYESMGLIEGGRWLIALGRPGSTASGGPADWATTLTIHDTMTGKPVLRIGAVGDGAQVELPWLGPAVATP